MGKERLSGTVWHGQARLDAGIVVEWQADLSASLLARAGVIDWTLTGPGTALQGRITARPAPGAGGYLSGAVRMGPVTINAVTGRLGWPLADALLPGLPIRCDAFAQIVSLTATLTPETAVSGTAVSGTAVSGTRSAEGVVTAPAGSCARTDGSIPPVATPALTAVLTSDGDGVIAALTTTEAPDIALVTARLTNADRIVLTIHAAGAALVPGMPSSSDSEIELPLSVLMP